jgi:hypothetical protein
MGADQSASFDADRWCPLARKATLLCRGWVGPATASRQPMGAANHSGEGFDRLLLAHQTREMINPILRDIRRSN